ncbi:MAG TPA: hypothetical protein VLK27_01645 [Chthoniobacterales bacterium]|nr:hypothetical protein [Chthoniobacterales bacterium]
MKPTRRKAEGEEKISVITATLLMILTAGCDPVGYGYVNQLRRPVSVVHHVHGRDERFTLGAGERKLPAMGDWPGSREEFFDLNGKEIAALTGAQIKKLQHTNKNMMTILVLSPSGITLATQEYWDQWQKELRDGVQR